MVHFDLLVIGAGPAGYTGAIRAAQLGFKVCIIDEEKALGGTCLRIGCIPSKALLESSELYRQTKTMLKKHGILVEKATLDLAQMLKRKDAIVQQLTNGVAGLMKNNKIICFFGHARLNGRDAQDRVVVQIDGSDAQILSADKVMIATGSVVQQLAGVELDGDRIGTSTEALAYAEVPKHLVVIGAGAIGLELGSVWQRLGAQVTVLEYADRILPGMDSEIAGMALKIFKRQGLGFELGARVTAARREGEGCIVEMEGRPPIFCDRVLLAVGRSANTQDLGLESMGIACDKRGRIAVDAHFASSVAGIFAVGDVIAGPMLAHKAEEEAVACVERIITGYGHVDYSAIPSVVYTEPEIATVGVSEDALKAIGQAYRRGTFPFAANGRAIAIGHTDGMVKFVADAATDRVLGCAIIGPRAGDLIAEVATAIAFGASSEDIARACHAHPSLAEVVKEAALAVDGRAINM